MANDIVVAGIDGQAAIWRSVYGSGKPMLRSDVDCSMHVLGQDDEDVGPVIMVARSVACTFES